MKSKLAALMGVIILQSGFGIGGAEAAPPYPECKEAVYLFSYAKLNKGQLRREQHEFLIAALPPCESFQSPAPTVFTAEMSRDLTQILAPMVSQEFREAHEDELQRVVAGCQQKLDEVYLNAILASEAVYDHASIPGYQMGERTDVSGKLGVRYESQVLVPKTPGKPHIVSIAGTQNLRDWISNVGLGAEKLPIAFEVETQRIVSLLRSGKDVVLTGHSMGGGLSQVVALKIADELAALEYEDKMKNRVTPTGKFRLVTFDSVGGKELAEIGYPKGQRHAKLIQAMRANPRGSIEPLTSNWQKVVDQSLHFRLEGDVVSDIGAQFGELRTIKPATAEKANALRAHQIRSLVEATQAKGFAEAFIETREPSKMAKAALAAGTALGALYRPVMGFMENLASVAASAVASTSDALKSQFASPMTRAEKVRLAVD